MDCKYEVKPFPFRFCEGCMLNGCYPWNDNPILLCSQLGGLHLVLLVTSNDEKMVRQCTSFKSVTEEMWKIHLEDEKRMAKHNEEVRLRAMDGKVLSSELLPAERIAKKNVMVK